MDPALHCDYCQGLGPNARGDWINCTLDATAVPSRDPECSICYDAFQVGQRTVRHDLCRHVFHLDCLNLWAPQLTDDDDLDGPATIDCPMCRQPVRNLNLGQYPKRVLKLATPNLAQLLLASIGQKKVWTIRRKVLMYLMMVFGPVYPGVLQFYRSHVCPDDRTTEYPTHLIPPGYRPHGSEIFEGMDTVQGGALVLSHCDHVCEYFILGPAQYYNIVSQLFANGWNPPEGDLIGRVGIGRPSWLSDLIALATNRANLLGPDNTLVEISHLEFASAFYNSQAIKFGSRMVIRITPSVNEPGKWDGTIIGFRQTGPDRRWQLLDHASTMRLVDGFGGINGTNLTLGPLVDAADFAANYSDHYRAIHSRFPPDFRPEDDPDGMET